MKRFIFLLAAVSILFSTSCYRHEMEKATAENDSLRLEISNGQENLSQFVGAFNNIQQNLDSIKRLEKLISVRSLQSPEKNRKLEDDINDDIRTIYDLLKQNREKLAALRRNALSSQHKAEELQKMVGWLESQIKEKDKEIEALRYQLAEKNIQIEGLESFIAQLEQQRDTLADIAKTQDSELHKRWYVMGTKDELIENGVITKTGGFLGIGKKKELKADFNKDYFTAIDIRETTRIPVYHDKIKILSKHPENSYRTSGVDKVEEIQILDTDKFWKASDYLVIMLK